MTYKTGRKTGEFPKHLHRLGKALASRSDFKAITDAAMNCPGLKKAIEDRICLLINDKCKKTLFEEGCFFVTIGYKG